VGDAPEHSSDLGTLLRQQLLPHGAKGSTKALGYELWALGYEQKVQCGVTLTARRISTS